MNPQSLSTVRYAEDNSVENWHAFSTASEKSRDTFLNMVLHSIFVDNKVCGWFASSHSEIPGQPKVMLLGYAFLLTPYQNQHIFAQIMRQLQIVESQIELTVSDPLR